MSIDGKMLLIANLFYYFVYSLIALIVFLFSALVISEQLRKLFFAKIFSSRFFEKKLKKRFDEHRKVWLKQLSQVKAQNSNEKLIILEVGTGEGANFDHYPDNSKLIALDYNENFKKGLIENLKKYPNIEFVDYFNESIEDMKQIEDNSIDVVLITHVFCSVPNVEKGLSEVYRVLKKGGKYFFFEHVAYHHASLKNNIWSFIQHILNPLWRILMGGCNLNRQIWVLLKNVGFKSIEINHVYPNNLPGFLRPHIWGFAQK